jgi:hypothetical protein
VTPAIKTAAALGIMQLVNWCLCTISWRAVSQANYPAAIVNDAILASLQFFVIRRMVKSQDEGSLIQWAGYTLGGVAGTVVGIWLSLWWLGK